jgi:hypothetical protein
MASSDAGDAQGPRGPYRDNDDQRDPLEGGARTGSNPDTKGEAAGDARDAVGNNARGTDAAPTGGAANDKTRNRDRSDEFEQDL